ncbi:hypothetical protein C8R45DRAFT_1090427 [Mycena sanguinolenta]|nr:hypothetical protein C8R45DRAFT_1090427 [Mycena sanguinolenta]
MSAAPPAVLATAHTRLDDARKTHDITPNSHTQRAVEDAKQAYLSALAAADAGRASPDQHPFSSCLSTAAPLPPRHLRLRHAPPTIRGSGRSRRQYRLSHRCHDGAASRLAPPSPLRGRGGSTKRFLHENGVGKVHACATFRDAVLILENQYQGHVPTGCPLPDLPLHPSPHCSHSRCAHPSIRSSVPPDYRDAARLSPRPHAAPSASLSVTRTATPTDEPDTTAGGVHTAQSPAGENDGGVAGNGRRSQVQVHGGRRRETVTGDDGEREMMGSHGGGGDEDTRGRG